MSTQSHLSPPSEAAAEHAMAQVSTRKLLRALLALLHPFSPNLSHSLPYFQLTPDQANILAFNSSPALAAALGVPAARLHQETLRLLQLPQPKPPSFQGHAFQPLPPPPIPQHRPFNLRLRHECTAIGCADQTCSLCSQAQSRRCIRDPAAKYLVGDALTAACGAHIAIEAVDPATGTILTATDLPGIALRVAVISAKRMDEGGSIESATVGKHASKPLLIAHKHTTTQIMHDDEGRAVLPVGAPLSSLAIAASSEAVLGGQRPLFQINVTPIDAESGVPLPGAALLLTTGFVVATPRVRSAVKRDIPHLSDPISKLKAVGKATQTRLRDLGAALAHTGGPPLQPPLAAVTTVADFRRLVEWARQDQDRIEKVKKCLKLTKGWDEACAHAATAVGSDTRLRMWRGGNADAAVVYRADQGLPQLSEGPLGVLKFSTLEAGPAAASLIYACNPRRGGELPWGGPVPESIISAALEAWHSPGHPGWSLLPTDTVALKTHAVLHPDDPLIVPAPEKAHPAPIVGRVLHPGAALPAYEPPLPAPDPPGGDDALAFSLAVAAVQAMQIPNNVLENLLEGLQAQEEAGAAAATVAPGAAPEPDVGGSPEPFLPPSKRHRDA